MNLLLLTACHIFSDGTLDTTCEDVGGCAQTDTGGGEQEPTDTGAERLEGELHYTWLDEDQVRCDAWIELAGVPYAGVCEGCDFVFSIEASVTQDDGDSACDYLPWLTLLPTDTANGDPTTPLIAYSPEYQGYTHLFMSGYMVGATGEDLGGPYWYFLAGDGLPYGTFARTGDDLSWSWVYDYTTASDTTTYPYINQCDEVPQTITDGAQAYEGATVAMGELPNGEYTGDGGGYSGSPYLDIWSFRGTSGDTISVTVDTVDDATAFDAALYVADEDTCLLGGADDSFDCTYPPLSYGCPSTRFVAEDTTYTVAVTTLGAGLSAWADYRLIIDAGADPGINLEHDDVTNNPTSGGDVLHQVAIDGWGTIAHDAR